jgi:phage-related protein
MDYQVFLLPKAVEFLNSLNIRFRAKSIRTIELLKQFGPVLPLPHSKKLQGKDNLYELRVKLGTDICRLFYFHDENSIYVVTSGFIKKSQKTDPQEIERAIRIRQEFLSGKGETK